MRFLRGGLAILITAAGVGAQGAEVPEDFPRFSVPGLAEEMESLRALHWLHYPGAGPKATLWDEWLVVPALWPAVASESRSDRLRQEWERALSTRQVDLEGYVATHQHASIAHPSGWPFPFFNQGQGGFGWHFSFQGTVGPPWRQTRLDRPDGWVLNGMRSNNIVENGWALDVVGPDASLGTPARSIDTFQSPFVQLRWATDKVRSTGPWLEWSTRERPAFGPERRMYFDPPDRPGLVYALVPLYRHPQWTGEVRQLRVSLGNAEPGGRAVVQALFSTYDTRHNVNAACFIRGCARYFWWTGDLSFLGRNIQRMRLALQAFMTEHHTRERHVVWTDWVGHDGRTGLVRDAAGKKTLRSGHGIGNNYWDLLPFGSLDAYATVHYYDCLQVMIRLEREIRAHPEWNVPRDPFAFDPAELDAHAVRVKAEANQVFWNAETGRFVACVDADGQPHDYGFTFLNLEAVHYHLATAEHAREILAWITGERTVAGDTAQGSDIYYWRFAPRATTRRNIDWYVWGWNAPESLPFGGQVQDGGAVLGFSYYDVMSRLRMRGPDDAWKRMAEIVRWFREVQAAGGYRKYYGGQRDGRLQGGGTPGGLGMDNEFFESVLVPQVMVDGFLGLTPTGDGFRLEPRLPADWRELVVDRIRWRDRVLRMRVDAGRIEIGCVSGARGPLWIQAPGCSGEAERLGSEGQILGQRRLERREDGAFRVDWDDAAAVVLPKR